MGFHGLRVWPIFTIGFSLKNMRVFGFWTSYGLQLVLIMDLCVFKISLLQPRAKTTCRNDSLCPVRRIITLTTIVVVFNDRLWSHLRQSRLGGSLVLMVVKQQSLVVVSADCRRRIAMLQPAGSRAVVNNLLGCGITGIESVQVASFVTYNQFVP